MEENTPEKYRWPSSRNAEVHTLKESFNQMLKAYRLKGKYGQTHVVASWERIMGKAVASRTSRLFIKNDILYVELESAPLKQQLVLGREQIAKHINEDAGQRVIEEVVFL